MKKQFSVAILLAIFVFALCGAACSDTRLSAPENIRIEADYLTWDKVDGADAYLVTVNGESTPVTDNKFDLLNVTTEYITYKMAVLAMSKNPSNDSLPSKMLVYKPQSAEGIFTYTKAKIGDKEGVMVSLKSGVSEDEIPDKLIIPDRYTEPGASTGASVIRIGKLANNKTKSIWIPNSVETIDSDAFSGSAQLERVKLPARLKTIRSIFRNCSKLQSVTLPGNLESISNNTFDNCTSLQELVFPDTFKSIGSLSNGVFRGCSSLKKIDVLQSAPDKKGNFYVQDGCLIDTASNTLIKAVGNFTVPEDVMQINVFAFADNETLTEFTVPDGITVIPSGAFSGCVNLKSINLNKATVFNSLNYPIFADCTSLTSITFPKNTTEITGNPFTNCTSLSSVEVDPACTAFKAINNFILNGNTLVCGLKASEFPLAVTKIGSYAFSYSDIEEAIIPNNVELSTFSFSNCTKLKSLTLPNTMTDIPTGAFQSCYNLENVVFPSSIVQISMDAFYKCFKLSVTIPKKVNVSFNAFTGVTVYTESTYQTARNWSGNGTIFIGAGILTENGKAYIDSYTLVTSLNDPTLIMNPPITGYSVKTLRAIPYREGYEFVGWKESVDGEVVHKPYTVTPDYENMTPYKACLTDDELMSIPSGTVLYAEWKKI